MAIQFGYNDAQHRIAALENEVDRLAGRPARNKYTCTACYGRRTVDTSYHGSPDFEPCSACNGGRLIDAANTKLLMEDGP